MKNNNFIKYLLLLGKEWVLWLFVIGDIGGIIADSSSDKLTMPWQLFVGIALMGFIIAGYRVYSGLLKNIPLKYIPQTPKIQFSLIEGSNYLYSVIEKGKKDESDNIDRRCYMDIKDGKLPKCRLVINARIENISDISMNLLSIDGKIDIRVPYDFMLPDLLTVDGEKIKFPVEIPPNSIFKYKYQHSLFPSNLTEAQIAVRTSQIRTVNKNYPFVTLFEISYGNNETMVTKKEFDISLRPLCDILYEYWHENENDGIIKLLA